MQGLQYSGLRAGGKHATWISLLISWIVWIVASERSGGGLQERSRHSAQICTQGDAFGNLHTRAQPTRGENDHSWSSLAGIQNGLARGDAPIDKGGCQACLAFVLSAVHFNLGPGCPSRAGDVDRGDTCFCQPACIDSENPQPTSLAITGTARALQTASIFCNETGKACVAFGLNSFLQGIQMRIRASASIISTARRHSSIP